MRAIPSVALALKEAPAARGDNGDDVFARSVAPRGCALLGLSKTRSTPCFSVFGLSSCAARYPYGP